MVKEKNWDHWTVNVTPIRNTSILASFSPTGCSLAELSFGLSLPGSYLTFTPCSVGLSSWLQPFTAGHPCLHYLSNQSQYPAANMFLSWFFLVNLSWWAACLPLSTDARWAKIITCSILLPISSKLSDDYGWRDPGSWYYVICWSCVLCILALTVAVWQYT